MSTEAARRRQPDVPSTQLIDYCHAPIQRRKGRPEGRKRKEGRLSKVQNPGSTRRGSERGRGGKTMHNMAQMTREKEAIDQPYIGGVERTEEGGGRGRDQCSGGV